MNWAINCLASLFLAVIKCLAKSFLLVANSISILIANELRDCRKSVSIS